MTDFMNSIKNSNPKEGSAINNFYVRKTDVMPANTIAQNQNVDTVDLKNKETIEKNKKKKIITYFAIGASVLLAIFAFFKRKQIFEFFSKIFKKNSGGDPPSSAGTTIPPKGGDVPPPNGGGSVVAPPKKPTTISDFPTVSPKSFAQEYEDLASKMRPYYSSPEPVPKELLELEKILKKRAFDENLSLVIKKDLSSLSDEERLKYFNSYVFEQMKYSESSALDGLEMFEKYGKKIVTYVSKDGDFKKTTLAQLQKGALTLNPYRISSDLWSVGDKTLLKYIDVMFKFMDITDKADRYLLNEYLNLTLRQKNISDETAIKVLDFTKKIIDDIDDYFVCDVYEQLFMSRPIVRKLKNSPGLAQALEDYAQCAINKKSVYLDSNHYLQPGQLSKQKTEAMGKAEKASAAELAAKEAKKEAERKIIRDANGGVDLDPDAMAEYLRKTTKEE